MTITEDTTKNSWLKMLRWIKEVMRC